MKAKRRKFNEEKQEEGKHLVEDGETEATMQLQPVDMAALFYAAKRNLPPAATSEPLERDFDVDNFFFPSLEASKVTESTTKKLCPFVRALSATMPNYKLILGPQASQQAKTEDFGSPLVLIVCASAIRATEVIKGISAKIQKCKIAKLFGKHIKITEQISMLSKDYHPIVIGTPHRIHSLIEMGALSLRKVKITMVDYTADIKHFTILTLPEVNKDFLKLAYQYIYPERDHMKLALVKDKPILEDREKARAEAQKKTKTWKPRK